MCFTGEVARVLVIDDDAELRVLVARALERAGHEAALAATGRAGLDLARSLRPDAILLELELPDVAGPQIARSLSTDLRTRAIPFLFVSARSSEHDRVAGLELGADDFVAKPFNVRELLLRVGVALRRASARASGPAPLLLERPPLTLDPLERRAFLGGKPLELTPTEFRLLFALAGEPERPQSRERLLTEVWGVAPALETRTVDMHVKRLREKLEGAAAMIETVRGVGYKMRAPPGAPWHARSS